MHGMVFDMEVAINWLLFLALFPLAFFWLRRAWRIGWRRDLAEVALKRGVAPPNAARFAGWELAINLAAGVVVCGVILGVLSGSLRQETWSAVAGSTIWCKLFASFALSRHAHAAAAREGGGPARSVP